MRVNGGRISSLAAPNMCEDVADDLCTSGIESMAFSITNGCPSGQYPLLRWITTVSAGDPVTNAHPHNITNQTAISNPSVLPEQLVCCDEILPGAWDLTYLSSANVEAHASNSSTIWDANTVTVYSNAYSCDLRPTTDVAHTLVAGCSPIDATARCSCDTTNDAQCGYSFMDTTAGFCQDYAFDDCGGGLSYKYTWTSATAPPCGADVCIFEMSDWDNAHIAECGAGGDLNWSMCCSSPEICFDGIDNDGNGRIDCADERCLGPPDAPINNMLAPGPQECTGSPINNTHCGPEPIGGDCTGADGASEFYCSYGQYEENTEGYCCPVGEWALWNPVFGIWECVRTEQCYDPLNIPLYACEYDYSDPLEWDDWNLSRTNVLSAAKWCTATPAAARSQACCPVVWFGIGAYWSDNPENVKIY